eukprot:9701679-Alexandrium_andersonii.AAC.1
MVTLLLGRRLTTNSGSPKTSLASHMLLQAVPGTFRQHRNAGKRRETRDSAEQRPKHCFPALSGA